MARLLPRTAAALLLFVAHAAAAAPLPGAPLPADATWALVAPAAGKGAAAAAAIGRVADTRGLQQGFAAALQAGSAFDPFDAEALQRAGVAPGQPLAIASVDGVQLGAVTLAAEERGRAHLESWLQPLAKPTGSSAASRHRGWKLELASSDGRVVAGYAIRGRAILTARLLDRRGDVAKVLHRAIVAAAGEGSLASSALFRKAQAEAGGASWYLWRRQLGATVAAGVSLQGQDQLRLRGVADTRHTGSLLGKGAAYPAAPTADGRLLLGRFHFSEAARRQGGQLAAGIAFLLRQACPSCGAAALGSEANTLASLLTGPAVLAVSRLDLKQLIGDRLDPAATPFAWVAQVRDPGQARTWLGNISSLLQEAAPGDGPLPRPLPTALGPLFFGLKGDRIYAATDPDLRDALLAATDGSATGPGAPLRLVAAPAEVGRALGCLSVADAFRGGLVGALFGVRLQLGPLLRGSGPLEVEAEPTGRGSYRIDARWRLRAGS